MSLKAGTKLEKVLAAGHFALTTEVGPPRGPDVDEVLKKAEILKGMADAYNVTDNQTAVVRMSSIAGSKVLLDAGLEPVAQMTCRDRNRIAMQSDLLGAAALGLKNILAISGDHQGAGASGKLKGHPGAKGVYDVDSIQLINIIKNMRDEGVQAGGDTLTSKPPFFIGAAWTPLGPPVEFRVLRLAKKVAAGADFIQTQAVYDIKAFAEQLAKAVDMGLTEKTAILPGLIVPRSAGMLNYMNNNVPGVVVPQELIDRMKGASDAQAEGIKVTIELIEQVKQLPGVKGVHLQAIEAEELLPEIINQAGLSPRPEV
ncbi:MAG: methylenetetrahydrofolate reductase [Deltaproteobacteria bacterium]|nr:methylenetetrahydrofolate reductase [Deltaproteobacteria bacterium]